MSISSDLVSSSNSDVPEAPSTSGMGQLRTSVGGHFRLDNSSFPIVEQFGVRQEPSSPLSIVDQ